MPGPLDGIKVLDFTRNLNGGRCGVWLSDYGADVIKLEPRITGDFSRTAFPAPPSDFSALFTCTARGKRGITMDLKKEKAREVVFKLAERCDVIISNYRIGVMERLGLGYEDIKKVNPKIIYGRSSGYGPKGPLAMTPANDFTALTYGGFSSVTGTTEEPMRVSASIGDLAGALCFTLGIVLAVVARERFGIGQTVDTSLLGGTLMLQSFELDWYCLEGKLPEQLRAGRYHSRLNATGGIHKTKDGWMAAGPAGAFDGYCEALGIPEVIGDPRYDPREGTRDDQLKYVKEFGAILDKAFQKKTTQEWMEILTKVDRNIQVANVNTYEDVVHDPNEQSLENGYLIEMDMPGLGPTKIVGAPATLGETPAKAQGLPPQLGQHTEEVLLELGYSWEDIAEMSEEEVI